MTNEELLAKYLENSLSETESAEFQKLLNSSPEFARDVRELSKIEEFLSAGTISAAVPEDFLASVENHVAEKIHHDKYHAPGSGNAFNKILSGFWIVPLLVLLGVGGYFLLRNSDENIQPAARNTVPVVKENTAPAQPDVSQPAASQSDIQPSQQQTAKNEKTDEITPQQPLHTPDEMKMKAENAQPDPDKSAFEKTREKLATARAEGKKATEAALLKQMGMIAATMGNSQEAKAYFNESITLARSLHLAELEAGSLGELGLAFKNEGDKDAAADSFKKAVELLKAAGQPAERWEKEWKSVQ